MTPLDPRRMELLCLGLSYRTAPLAVRERLALPEACRTELLHQLAEGPTEALLLSTCNRVELYLATSEVPRVRQRVLEQLRGLGGPEVLGMLHEHRGAAALTHLFRVASSLDSMVLGETQVLGQVKDALEHGQRAGTVRGELARVFAAAFRCAKRIRTRTAIGRAALSMASAAVTLVSRTPGGLADKTVVLVGAGELAELAARHLVRTGVRQLLVVNRTRAHAEELVARVGGSARPFESLPTLLASADVVVSGTSSPLPLFTRENVAAALGARAYRPLLMVDLAVPRDIAPDVGTLVGVHVLDVDDIQRFVTENATARASEARKAEGLVSQEVERFQREQALREEVPVLALLRRRADTIARAEVERTLESLGGTLSDKQRKHVEAMAHAIVNKLLHAPTAHLRTVGGAPEGERIADVVAQLFELAPA